MPEIRKTAAKKQDSVKSRSEKEIQKLRRMDLLELLLDEMRQNEQNTATVAELTDLTERLKAKLDDKDAQIERLKAKLDEKDAEIEHLEERNRNVARAVGALDIQELLEVETRAVEDYLAKLAAQAGEGQ